MYQFERGVVGGECSGIEHHAGVEVRMHHCRIKHITSVSATTSIKTMLFTLIDVVRFCESLLNPDDDRVTLILRRSK